MRSTLIAIACALIVTQTATRPANATGPAIPPALVLVDVDRPESVLRSYDPADALACWHDMAFDHSVECRPADDPARQLTACELADIAPTDSNIEACLGRPWWQAE